MPNFKDPITLITAVITWVNTLSDWLPTLHQRMANRERRKRLQHAKGKISDAELEIELEAIRQKLAAT
jgi:hypothetical protein